MDVRLMFPRRYLGAPDMQGKEVTLTIRDVQVDRLKKTDGTSEKKPVVFFEETKAKAERSGDEEKRLVLNKTNATTIAGLYGWEADDWKGKRITLFSTTTAAFGKTVECIRIKDTIPPPRSKREDDSKEEAA